MKSARVFLVCMGWLALSVPAMAHVVVTDGTIGVTMHVDPDDAPVSGSPSRFFFWFKDTSNHLDPAHCKGSFTVANADNFMVSSQPLFAQTDSGLVSVHDVTFPKPGVYTVRLNGAPVGVLSFQPFLIEFKVRVTVGASVVTTQVGETPNWWQAHWPHFVLGSVLVALILWWGLRPPTARKKKVR